MAHMFAVRYPHAVEYLGTITYPPHKLCATIFSVMTRYMFCKSNIYL